MAASRDIISQVQSLKRRPDAVIVEVAVTGPVNLEASMAQRARARALIAAGILPTSVDTITDVAMGEIKRLTDVTGSRPGEDVKMDIPVLGKLLQTKVFTIEVNRE